MKKVAFAIATVAAIGVTSVAGTAVAAQSRPSSVKMFKVTVSPSAPKRGTSVTAVGTGAPKKAGLDCLEILMKKGFTPGQSQAYVPTLRTATSNAKGRVVCTTSFLPFNAKARGKTRYCPPTKADKKSGWGCGIIIATADGKYAGQGKFKF